MIYDAAVNGRYKFELLCGVRYAVAGCSAKLVCSVTFGTLTEFHLAVDLGMHCGISLEAVQWTFDVAEKKKKRKLKFSMMF